MRGILALSLLPAAVAAVIVAAADPAAADITAADPPVCAFEDCSDQPGQIGVWIDPDTGQSWLSLGGERSVAYIEGCGPDYAPDDDAGCLD